MIEKDDEFKRYLDQDEFTSLYNLKDIRKEYLNVLIKYKKGRPNRRHSIGEF